jgi:hypothetical protein
MQQEQSAFELTGEFVSGVPEPAALGLTGVGIAMGILTHRRRAQRT